MNAIPKEMIEKDPFRTRDHVPDFDAKLVEYANLSARTRRTLRMEADVSYGSQPDEKLDLFFPKEFHKPAPVHIFIHGGYWRMFSKSDFSFVANTVTAAGAIAVIIDYSLMPQVRLAQIVEQVREARRWVTSNIANYGGDPGCITVSGHSAGAHLATFLFTKGEEARLRGALLLGGVYDLKPLRQSFLQPLIHLTENEVRLFSPVDQNFQPRVNSIILYGERETGPFRAQAGVLAWQLKDAGCIVSLSALRGADHMSSVLDLGFHKSQAGRRLTSLILKR